MKPISQNSELISALADGQLESEDFARALAVCEGDAQALDSWHTYHLIGDVLRSPDAMAPTSDAAFVTRLRARLSQEPLHQVVPAVDSDLALQTRVLPAGRPANEAVNDTSFRWKMIAGFVSVAAVVAVTWNVGSGLLAPSVAPQLARAEPAQQVLVMSDQGAVLRDARMEELLAAHKQFGGTSALQMPSGFLRNATFETPQGERR
ncbi:sigma-E factor negative regulatory protein [Polaromonas sp. SM01]|uniref:sigma-E factor negative regulatory protein n=1 Tax=Polaromonas sp. SM01 TaxID=3085630 RepID=UPI0029813210|nr:sigma-E factor negative regulatory protein [Polaromonas sp. SM01]MDW5443695.1 sigma-E factor negative regulatory protein [Polaromonas sp. SM01]